MILAILITQLVTALSVHGQTEIQPLSDDEFKQVLASGDTARWAEIRALTDAQAEALGKSKGFFTRSGGAEVYGLWLNNLEQITDQQAKSISHFHGHFLFLDGLDTISLAQIKSLALFKPATIKNLTRETAYMTWYRSRGVLSLGGLSSITDEQSKALGGSFATTIHLDGVTNLTKIQAKRLASFSGLSLDLTGLKSLSEDEAAALAEYTGTVTFEAIDDTSVVRFAKHEGKYRVPPYRLVEIRRLLNR